MTMKTKHEQTVRELIKAVNEHDAETVRAIVFDQSIQDFEAIWLVATACQDHAIDCSHLALHLFHAGSSLWRHREAMAKQIDVHGAVDDVVRELGERDRPVSCCLVALVCDWSDKAARQLAAKMEYLNEHPECVGS